jgi:hypothetical protein
MTPRSARSVSLAVLGGVAAVLFAVLGLVFWVGLLTWAMILGGSGEPGATKKVIAGNLFGACIAWASVLVRFYVAVPETGSLWMLRLGFGVGVMLLLLGLSTKIDLLSNLSAALLGCVAVFGVLAVPVGVATGIEHLTGLHMYNPLLLVIPSMLGGAVFAAGSEWLTKALAKP